MVNQIAAPDARILTALTCTPLTTTWTKRIVETTFVFGRHTGVTNEPRAIVADWNEGEQRLTVYQGTQAPHMMQNLFAKHLGLEEHQVRVLTKDVGGSFGIKVHVYADEMATAALAKLLKRPTKRAD